MQPDLNLYRVLDAIHETGGVTAAARALNLTQPAISHALARLRVAFDDPLFVRQGNHLIPTARTEAVIGEVRRHLRGLQGIIHLHAAFDPARWEGEVVVGIRDMLESIALPALAATLATAAPKLRLISRRVATGEVARQLGSGQLDLAIERRLPPHPQMRELALVDDDLVVAMRRDHPAAANLSRSHYLAATHVSVAPLGETGTIDLLLRNDGRERRIGIVCQHYFAACQIAAAGEMLLTLPRSYARRMADLLPIAVCELPLRIRPYPLLAYWHDSRDDDPALAWLRERIADAVIAATGDTLTPVRRTAP
ncbi:DNA-binding transcriptional LysR family regulator [Endobacter medicaginis]|uniref:DNA-binding transcriptional LysR family regulator n=3 Tax=Endobacter medicaginis TaxID=1181271 RepID=A0A839V0H5_9PROT|nr:LysR family transcriptional regulator [Endobacter medicaginis]MBB3174163.1 DNA-binding transcriptional LysR family regulator [Endobacter medicaginis]MCX5474207.1 LysR family transcriptional regulator [Endobacter medicaginis]